MRAVTLLWAVLAAVAGTGLFLLKYQVQAEERHLRDVRKDIAGSEQAIHVLKAEWSYLNDPMRLREQAERHLDMRPMRANQIVAIDAIPLVGGPPFTPPGLTIVKNGVSAARHNGKSAPSKADRPSPPPADTSEKDEKAHKPAAPAAHKPGGKTMTADLAGAKADKGRHIPQVASSRIRP
jgi:hypothetical protein